MYFCKRCLKKNPKKLTLLKSIVLLSRRHCLFTPRNFLLYALLCFRGAAIYKPAIGFRASPLRNFCSKFHFVFYKQISKLIKSQVVYRYIQGFLKSLLQKFKIAYNKKFSQKDFIFFVNKFAKNRCVHQFKSLVRLFGII